MSVVKETCRCGAIMEYEGRYPQEASDTFRRDHRICRENRWPWWGPTAMRGLTQEQLGRAEASPTPERT